MDLCKIASLFNAHPKLKRFLKNGYQIAGGMLSDRKTLPENIICISDSKQEHLFGYYDKSPWNADGTKMIYLEVQGASKRYVSDQPASIIIKDLSTGKTITVAKTNSWNVQQGCMLQWLGPDFDRRIIYNDFRDGKYCSVILDLKDRSEQVIDFPVYTVSSQGDIALSLDFSRLNTFRPGYGYCNIPDQTSHEKCPDSPCVWKVDLIQNKAIPLFTYRQLYEFHPKPTMDVAYHKVNHIMISPNADKFMFLHRWIAKDVKYDRLLTCKIDGSGLYDLLDEDMVSHSNWRDNDTIITFANTYQHGNHYYILRDKTQIRDILGEKVLLADGHPSYSPDGKWIVTDTYPTFNRKQTLYLINTKNGEIRTLGQIYANVRYRNELRCDLHPRWKRDSSEICFDGAQAKLRQIYTLKI